MTGFCVVEDRGHLDSEALHISLLLLVEHVNDAENQRVLLTLAPFLKFKRALGGKNDL